MPIYFHNPGEIDIRGATIMGLHAKDEPDSAIGFFGTGLKYGIASVLRWGGSIEVWSGLARYSFGASDLDFRGKSFQQISMAHPDSEFASPLGFTTEYGRNWEPWQVFREFYSNALDEGGGVSNQRLEPEAGTTIVAITCPQLEAEYYKRNSIILPPDTSWAAKTEKCCVGASSSPVLYYRSVRVHERRTALTYNFLQGLSLTEDRTVKYSWMLDQEIALVLAELTDEQLIERALLADEEFHEIDCDFASGWAYSPEFLAVAERLWKQDPQQHKRFGGLLHQHRPDSVARPEIELTTMQQLMLDRAKRLVALMGMPVESSPISVVDLGASTLGQCKNGKVYLDPKVFEQGTKQVVSTLYEELLHLTTGMEDCTYKMQTHLFNKIVSMYEEHVFKEPC